MKRGNNDERRDVGLGEERPCQSYVKSQDVEHFILDTREEGGVAIAFETKGGSFLLQSCERDK